MEELIRGKSLPKAYMKLSLPVVFSMVITLIYNLADTYFISQTGNTDLVAGISLCAPIFTMLMAFGNIYGQGGSSLIARLLGKKDENSAGRVSSFCFYIAIATGVIIGALLIIFQGPMLTLIGANPDTLPYASQYYIVLAIGAPFSVLSFVHSNLLRSEGLAIQSMIGTVGGAVVNIILDPILISALGMGASGAAIATVIGYISSDVFFLIVVLRKSRFLSVSPKKWKVSGEAMSQIFGVGVTAAIANLASSLCLIMVNQFMLPYGNDKIAALGIVFKVSMIVTLVLTGFSFGGQPLFSYLYGAGDTEKLNKLIHFCLKFIGGLALIMSALLFAFAPMILKCFLDTGNIVSDGTVMLRFQISTMVFVGIQLLFTVLFQATGKVGAAFAMSISRQGVVFVIVLLIAGAVGGYYGILMSQPISDIISAALAVVMYIKIFKISAEKT